MKKPVLYVICGTFDYKMMQLSQQLGGRMIVGSEGVRGGTVAIPEGGVAFMPNGQVALESFLEKVEITVEVHEGGAQSFLQGLRDYKGIKY